MESGTEENWLTTLEVAELLRVHPKHVYRLLQQGLPARRVGGQWRFSSHDIRDWAVRRGAKAPVDTLLPRLEDAAGVLVLAGELGPMADALRRSLAGACPLALLPANQAQACALLSDRVAHAAVFCGDPVHAFPFPTIVVQLAALDFGWFGSSRRHAKSVALPSSDSVAGAGLNPSAMKQGTASVVVLDTDADCAFAVSGGRADRGFGSGWWASRLGLPFRRTGSLPMQLVVPADPTATAAAGPLIEAVQAGRLAGCLDGIPGLKRQRCGEMRFVPTSRAVAPATSTLRSLPSDRPSRWAMVARAGSAPVVQMVEHLRERGLRVGGFLQVPCGPQDCILGYDLVRLGKPDRVPIADRVAGPPEGGQAFCQLSFRKESLVAAFQWLQEDATSADVLVIDGVGKLEGKGRGHFPALRWVREMDRPLVVLVSSRADVIPSLRKKLGLPGLILEGVPPQHPDPWLDRIYDCCKEQSRPRARRLSEGNSP